MSLRIDYRMAISSICVRPCPMRLSKNECQNLWKCQLTGRCLKADALTGLNLTNYKSIS